MKEGSLAYLEQLLRHAPWLGGDEEKEVPYTTAALAGIEGSIPVSSWSTSEVVVLLLVLCIVLLMGYHPALKHTHTHSFEKKSHFFICFSPTIWNIIIFFQQHFLL